MTTERHLSPAEIKAQLGLTTKALRLYEAIGLVRPMRTSKGWRVYSEADALRLYQVKVLRRFGLSVDRIGEVLKSPEAGDGLVRVLALQSEAVQREIERLSGARELLARARTLADGGQPVRLDDLVALSEQAEPEDMDTIADRLRPYIERYFTPADYRALEQANARNWQGLVDETRALRAQNPDPKSAGARALLTRWRAMTQFYSGGDAAVEAKSAKMFAEAMSHPDPSRHPIPLSIWTFLLDIAGHLEDPS